MDDSKPLSFTSMVTTYRRFTKSDQYAISICKSCGTQHTSRTPHNTDCTKNHCIENHVYETQLRTWNCCNDENTPRDGFPDPP